MTVFRPGAVTHREEPGKCGRAAFAHHPSVADLVELVRASPEYLPDLALVALADEAVVGHVMVGRASLVEEDGTRHGVLTLSPLAVAPSHQGRGSITLPEWAPPEAAMVYPLPGYRPEVRGHVEYPPAFAQLD